VFGAARNGKHAETLRKFWCAEAIECLLEVFQRNVMKPRGQRRRAEIRSECSETDERLTQPCQIKPPPEPLRTMTTEADRGRRVVEAIGQRCGCYSLLVRLVPAVARLVPGAGSLRRSACTITRSADRTSSLTLLAVFFFANVARPPSSDLQIHRPERPSAIRRDRSSDFLRCDVDDTGQSPENIACELTRLSSSSVEHGASQFRWLQTELDAQFVVDKRPGR
jgi:hypothetical protein